MIHNCRLLADMGKCFGLSLGIENEWSKGALPKTPKQFKELIDSVERDNFGITLDIKHAETSGEMKSSSVQYPDDKIRQGRHG